MPVKRRTPKARRDDAAELAAWSMTFQTGRDYFHDLAPFGIDGMDSAAVRTAARAAWRRLGARFMETWSPDPAGRQRPWALEELGAPRR